MPAGELIRKNLFWFTDTLKDKEVAGHMEDIDRLLRDGELSEMVNSQRLRELMEHACRNTGFYREYKGCLSLSDFPVVKKETIKKTPESFLSGAFKKEELIPMTTSGSYGVPMKFYISSEKKARQRAEVIYFASWSGYEVGLRHAYVRAQPAAGGKSNLKLFIQNEILMDSTVLSREWMANQRGLLRKKDIHHITGYASAITALSEYITKCKDEPGMYDIRGVVAIAEPFSEDMRKTVERAFDCPVIGRYSSQELGVLACECPENHVYHINNGSYIIELLKLDRDEETVPGDLGRVVVTDLFSHAQPLIRYDTGDLAVMGESCTCGRSPWTFKCLDGRLAAMIYNTGGDPVHFASIVNRVWDMKDVLMYQFIQEDKKNYNIKFVPMVGYDESQEGFYIRRMKELLGEDAKIFFQRVEEIPPLKSGKRPFYVNNYRG